MENEHELSYKTLKRVYLGSYEHYKSVGVGGGDVVRLGTELERLWCKVDVCGGVCGGDLAVATLRLQRRDVTLKRGRDGQDKDEEPSAGSNQGTKRRRSGKEESSKEATQKEPMSTISSKGTSKSQPKSLGSQTPDCEWNKIKTVDDRPPQSWMTQLAQASGTQSSFNEFLATPIDFSVFIMNWLKLNNLTQDVLSGPTYDLMKGRCKSVVELEYHLEELFKATNDLLDWHNPKRRPYPHDLSKPLPLIQNARGRQVIPFDHFINNDLEYLKGGSLSQKYTTLITKTKAADYGHVKWIEDKVPRTIWSRAQVVYDKHAYWGTYHWGPKRQRFYGYTTNIET
ncbi:hypothetical protein Tco_0150435 [Tanacetum coccineum]